MEESLEAAQFLGSGQSQASSKLKQCPPTFLDAYTILSARAIAMWSTC